MRGFLRDVFLDPEDLEYERRFDMRSLPLAALALAAGFAYSRTGASWLAAVSAVCMAAYVVYFVVNRSAYVIRLVRGRGVLGGRARRTGPVRSPAWVRWLERVAGNDTAYALVGGYGVPVAGSVVVAVWSVTGWPRLLWLAAALAAVYAAYWLMMLFVRANRRLSGLLRDRETRLGEARSRMDRMRRDCELAGRTHDTVAGGLSYIAFLAQQRMEDSDLDDEEREAWQRVDQAAQRTLDNVHRVIDVLDGGETPPGSGCLADLLGGRVKAGVARLRTLGFDGTISVDVDGLPGVQVGEAASREASDLVDELFVNIAAHADPDQPYSLDVAARSGRLRVVQTDVAAGRGRFRRARSGRGARTAPPPHPGARRHAEHVSGGRGMDAVRGPAVTGQRRGQGRDRRCHDRRETLPDRGCRRARAGPGGRPMNIGDVDNDELVLGALSSSLAGAFGRDAVAWRCLSGRRAVSLCLDGRTRPDVLLMDVSLSDMSGIEACRRIRERDGDMPVLMITAFPIDRPPATPHKPARRASSPSAVCDASGPPPSLSRTD